MIIKVDSREQNPYSFAGKSVVGKLDVGDYSIEGLEYLISIERKSLPDLMQSISHQRVRFERELFRGLSLRYFCLVVEASLSTISDGCYRSQMNPKAAIQSLIAFSIRYSLPVWFAENREMGARVTESLLLKFGREIEKEFKAVQVVGGN